MAREQAGRLEKEQGKMAQKMARVPTVKEMKPPKTKRQGIKALTIR
jgi:hypothetical protein